MTVAMSSVGCVGLTNDIRGSSVDAVKEPLTLWTAIPTFWNAPPTWNAGHGFVADRLASATGAPVVALMPQNPLGTAGSSRNPRPRTKRWRTPAPSRWKPLSTPLLPAAGPIRYTPRYFSKLLRPSRANRSLRSVTPLPFWSGFWKLSTFVPVWSAFRTPFFSYASGRSSPSVSTGKVRVPVAVTPVGVVPVTVIVTLPPQSYE